MAVPAIVAVAATTATAVVAVAAAAVVVPPAAIFFRVLFNCREKGDVNRHAGTNTWEVNSTSTSTNTREAHGTGLE